MPAVPSSPSISGKVNLFLESVLDSLKRRPLVGWLVNQAPDVPFRIVFTRLSLMFTYRYTFHPKHFTPEVEIFIKTLPLIFPAARWKNKKRMVLISVSYLKKIHTSSILNGEM